MSRTLIETGEKMMEKEQMEEQAKKQARKLSNKLIDEHIKEQENMHLYHGSKKRLSKLTRQQAWGPPGTPKEESLDMIYLTPDFAFALVSGARPEGITEVNHKERTVHFENPEKFDPEKEVYIYIVDSSKIPSDKQKQIENQVVVDLDEIVPDKVEVHKASEVYQYYKVI